MFSDISYWNLFRFIDQRLLRLWNCRFLYLLRRSHITFATFRHLQSVFLCKLSKKLLVLRPKVLKLKLKRNILLLELTGRLKKFTGRIRYPLRPLDNTFLGHPKQTGKNRFKFGQLFCFGIWTSCVFDDCLLVCFIYCDCDKNGEYARLDLIYKVNIALFECIFEILNG